jgi:DNA helicase HerA-like ATPase
MVKAVNIAVAKQRAKCFLRQRRLVGLGRRRHVDRRRYPVVFRNADLMLDAAELDGVLALINVAVGEAFGARPLHPLLWLLSELFEKLPEVGDLDRPKLVFFFDEAHLLFNNAPKDLSNAIEQVVRLIRSIFRDPNSG